MATLVDSPIQQKKVLYIKGAPEIVMRKCNLSSEEQAHYNADLLAYQNKAMRTLGLIAQRTVERQTIQLSRLAANLMWFTA